MHAPTPHRAPRFRHVCALVVGLASLGNACGGTPRRPTTSEAPRSAQEITGESFSDAQRDLDETAATTPGYAARREAVARYLAVRGMDAINDGETESAIRSLRSALVHYTPEELGRGGLPAEVGTLARAVLEQVAPRGDEAHALAANRVLSAVAPPDAQATARFQEIYEWGDRNRREFDTPWVHLGEMADLFKEVARIVPAPDVLRRASELLIARHRAALEGRSRPPPAGRRYTFEDVQQLQAGLRNSTVDLAIVFLRIGDLQGAADQVAQISESQDGGLAGALRSLAAGEGGAEALGELASRLERVDAAAAEGICRRGRRMFAQDARFAQCLAVAAAREGNYGLASAHLEAASRLSPGDARTLRAALEATVEWLMRELSSEDPAAGRRAFARARAMLDAWRTANPRQPAPVTEGELEELAAQLELSQANLRAAQEHLEHATQAQPPARDAFLTLAEIAWRRNDPRRAIDVLQRGLALPLRPTESDSTFRPTFVLRMGLAAKAAGDEALARQHLTAAAEAFDALTRSLEGNARANALFLRGVALSALGQPEQVRPLLNAALDAAPENRELAGRVITFALAQGRWQDARDIDAQARAQLNLDRTWQVYFGLWGAVAARVGHLDSDGGAGDALETIARAATPHSPWTVRLAQRFTNRINREELARQAQGPGQRAEALFYEAMLELAAGDTTAAERDLRDVLQTDMLRFYEYEMAWQMLARGLPALLATPQPAVTPTAAPTATSTASTTRTSPAPAPTPGTPPGPRPNRRGPGRVMVP